MPAVCHLSAASGRFLVLHVATLELGQQHASRIDLVENCGQLDHDVSPVTRVPQERTQEYVESVAVCKLGQIFMTGISSSIVAAGVDRSTMLL